MTDAVLLEIEGVLVQTEPLWRAALAEAMAAHGVEPNPDAADPASALGVRARVEHALRGSGGDGDETLADLLVLATSRAFEGRLGGGITLAPGGRELVEDARSRARVAVVTRGARAHADAMLSMAGLEGLVEFIVSEEDAAAKPSPASYERALERLARRRGVARRSVLALEDGETGARAARLASLRCVVVQAAPEADAVADVWIPSLEGHDLASLERLAAATGARPR